MLFGIDLILTCWLTWLSTADIVLIYEQYFSFNIAVLNSSLNPLKVDFFYQDFALAFIATKWSHVIIARVNQRSLPSDHQ